MLVVAFCSVVVAFLCVKEFHRKEVHNSNVLLSARCSSYLKFHAFTACSGVPATIPDYTTLCICLAMQRKQRECRNTGAQRESNYTSISSISAANVGQRLLLLPFAGTN